MGRILFLTIIVALSLLMTGCEKSKSPKEHQTQVSYVVSIIEPMQHIAVSDITRGIKEGLQEDASTSYIEVIVQNANGDKTLIPQIIANVKNKSNIIVPIFTSTSQMVASSIEDKPVVFAAVTDPLAAKLVSDLKAPGKNITGVSDLWPISSQFDLIGELIPNANKVGMIFDPADPSSAATMPLIEDEINKRGWQLISKPISTPAEITQSLASLGQVDLIFTANDVTITSAFSSLVAHCTTKKIPLFAGDYSSVQRGAIAAIGQNYYLVGRFVAKSLSEIANGTSPGNIPVKFTSGGDLHINTAAAQMMGLAIPEEVLSKAAQVYKQIDKKEE